MSIETKMPELESRRPLKSRGNGAIKWLVEQLLKTSITPNQISVLSVVFAAAGAVALVYAPQNLWLYLITALAVQLRLLCNLLDGMIAVEGGRASPVGSLYNEIPDRIADSLFLVAWGYAAGQVWPGVAWLGWAAALTAAVTAYIRVLGGSLGLKQDFRGPMAKQHRMAVLTLICLIDIAESMITGSHIMLIIGLAVVMVGSVWTCIARARAIATKLEESVKTK